MLELNGGGYAHAPFPYSIGPEFDRVPPLRPHPPYANSMYGPGTYMYTITTGDNLSYPIRV